MRRNIFVGSAIAAAFVGMSAFSSSLVSGQAAGAAQGACESLASLALPHTSVTSAAVVPEGPVGGGRAGGPAPIVVPARCVVKAVTKPSSDSEIRFEVWMPVAGWNGKYQQAGNGGWAGSIPAASLVAGVMRGYATAGTDDGHAGGPWAEWAIGHPEKLVDFGHRAVHETSVQAKAIVAAFYKRDPSKSYFVGCSDGGREALMEAQRYPDDFHGIIAGAPANNWTGLMTMALTIERALDEANLPATKLPAIQTAALSACDSLDEVKDGLIEDPRVCRFDPAVLTCKGQETDQCLTAPQVITLRKIYEGPRHPRTGVQVAPGFVPGTEAVPGGWVPWIIPPPPSPQAQVTPSIIAGFGNSFYGQAVAEDPRWDFRKWNFESDLAFAVEKTGGILNSMSPDLRSFRAAGGKLLQYHGWGDAAIPAPASIEYYDRVRTFMAKYPGRAEHVVRCAGSVLPPLHGSRDGALRWRLRAQHIRQRRAKRRDSDGRSRSRRPRGARALGRAQRRARSYHCQRYSGRRRVEANDTAALSVSADCPLQRRRRSVRGRQLHLRRASRSP